MKLPKRKVPIQESTYVCTTLAIVGGFLEAYTYLLKGGVFCNAQTGNIALLGIALANRDFKQAVAHIIPMLAYIIGILLTVIVPKRLTEKSLVKWDTIFVFIEILVLGGIAFLPANAPFMISNVLISFICAMQYNTFRKTNQITFATTFCTNNLRQASIHFYEALQTKSKSHLKISGNYLLINCFFMLGALLGTLCSKQWAERSVLFCCAILVPAFFALLFDSRSKYEKKSINL